MQKWENDEIFPIRQIHLEIDDKKLMQSLSISSKVFIRISSPETRGKIIPPK